MIRNSIKCSNCGCNDFEVEESIIPSGISLVCEKCGIITPLVVFSENKREIQSINDKETMELYNQSSYKTITEKMIRDARYKKG